MATIVSFAFLLYYSKFIWASKTIKHRETEFDGMEPPATQAITHSFISRCRFNKLIYISTDNSGRLVTSTGFVLLYLTILIIFTCFIIDVFCSRLYSFEGILDEISELTFK